MSDALKVISDLASDLRKTQQRIDELETALARAQTREKDIAENLLPEQMAAIGMEEFTAAGLKITLGDVFVANISQANTDAAFSWLDTNGHGGMIKREVVVALGKDNAAAQELLKDLRSRYREVKNKSAVHAGTLKKWVREMTETGKEIPDAITWEKKVIAKAKIQ